MPRSPDNGLTVEPCGDVAPGAPTMFMAGETITVNWAVGQAHGGFLQVDFAAADDVFDDTMILATDIPDTEGSPTSMDVTLPDIDCDACTLRLIQINAGKSNYVSCVDVQLSGAGGSSSSGGSGGSSGVTSGDESTTGGGGSSSGGPEDTSSSGPDGSTSNASASATAGNTVSAGTDPSGSGDGSGSTSGADEDDAGGCGCTSSGDASPFALALLGLVALRRRRRR